MFIRMKNHYCSIMLWSRARKCFYTAMRVMTQASQTNVRLDAVPVYHPSDAVLSAVTAQRRMGYQMRMQHSGNSRGRFQSSTLSDWGKERRNWRQRVARTGFQTMQSFIQTYRANAVSPAQNNTIAFCVFGFQKTQIIRSPLEEGSWREMVWSTEPTN